MTPLTKLKEESFHWSEEDQAFQALKGVLSTAPILQLPDFVAGFIVECDATGMGFGTVLHQGAGPLAFFSKPIATRHAKLIAYEQELIGLVYVVRHW